MSTIDLAVAKAMVANYTATRRTLIDKTLGINDTKGIWFSIDQVKDFVNNLPDGLSGVRIYLAAYDLLAVTYPNQTTIIAIGTVLDAAGNNVDPISDDTAAKPADNGNPPVNGGILCPPYTGCKS